MLSRKAPASRAVSGLSTLVRPSSVCAVSRLSSSGQQARGLATVQDAPPPKRTNFGGLKDQDRIFQNLYGHHGADLKSAKKYGDWYKTKEILDKGHDWVCARVANAYHRRILMLDTDHFRDQGIWSARAWWRWIPFRNEMGTLCLALKQWYK